MVRDEDVYPRDTVVRLHKTGEFAMVKRRVFLMGGKNFLHYEGPIDGRGNGYWAFYHQECDLECFPIERPPWAAREEMHRIPKNCIFVLRENT